MLSRSGRLILQCTLVCGVVLGLVRCDWLPEPAEQESLVVETFLETEQPLPVVELRKTRALGAPTEARADAATDAQVTLRLDGDPVSFEEAPQRPGRYQPVSSADSVPSRVPWTLQVQWNGETARASGVTPPPLRATETCVTVPAEPVRAVRVDSLRRDSLDIPTERGYIYPIDVSVQWERTDLGPRVDTTQWMRTQLQPDTSQFASRLVDRFLQPTEVRREDRFLRVGTNDRRWTGVYAVPVDSSTAPLPPHRLVATVVRGDSSFANFAQSRTDPELREPISNVEGGLGIATALAVDSLVRSVGPDTDGCVRPEGPQADENPAVVPDVQ